jgi:hypothetical protein
MTRLTAIAALLGLLASGTARADVDVFPATSDAGIRQRGSWQVGLVSPSRVGLDRLVELESRLGWWMLLSPNLGLRLAHLNGDRLRLTSSIWLSTPTPALRLLKGYLLPSWDRSDRDAGWFVVPELGLCASTGRRLVLSLGTSVAVGLGIGESAARPLDTYAPIELAFAPALNGFRVSTTAVGDYRLLRWLRLRLELSLHAIGEGDPPRSPWIVQGSLAADLALGHSWRLSVGVTWYNHDQHAQEVVRGADGRWERRDVRSNDVYPMFDVAWLR